MFKYQETSTKTIHVQIPGNVYERQYLSILRYWLLRTVPGNIWEFSFAQFISGSMLSTPVRTMKSTPVKYTRSGSSGAPIMCVTSHEASSKMMPSSTCKTGSLIFLHEFADPVKCPIGIQFSLIVLQHHIQDWSYVMFGMPQSQTAWFKIDTECVNHFFRVTQHRCEMKWNMPNNNGHKRQYHK